LSSAVRIVEVAELDLAFEPRPLRFAQTHAEAIATHWARLRKEKPEFYNGRVLLMRRWALAPRIDGRLRLEGDYFETDFADYVAWRAIDDSNDPAVDCFAMAALRSADGAFLLGEMATHTMNGGQIYFPAGTPDPSDVVDGKVDLEASARRELLEETGIRAEDAVVEQTWMVVFAGWRIACIKSMTLPVTADKAKARIDAFLAREALPELTRMHIVRRASDIDEARMLIFVTTYLRAALEGGGKAAGKDS
jgi:8-oxo-dGTP pyrophosphatase MutT (NUDIX family)